MDLLKAEAGACSETCQTSSHVGSVKVEAVTDTQEEDPLLIRLPDMNSEHENGWSKLLVDDSDMLEYLDTNHSDSDFILESDTMIHLKKMMPHMPHLQLLTLCLIMKRITHTHKKTKNIIKNSKLMSNRHNKLGTETQFGSEIYKIYSFYDFNNLCINLW
ncbi:uncharacterized protein LOC111867110 isoform X2 [Cryptotermes secundus]|uniref:uncharacterized protein LOC111867110 isoform X2 n=1 Tax=Cryptotermes secundus TaxID=105785 RepID=UPI000CD7BD3C|nr:uncharacterized protein LOC111867110 isoform X2 [Cryptotermes secundus]